MVLTRTYAPAFSAPKTRTACSSNSRCKMHALTVTTGPEPRFEKRNRLADTAINNSARLSDLEITWLGISSNLRAGPSESNVLVHPESLGADDKGQCGRAWRLASLLASHLTSDQDGVFGPIFLFGASLAPALLVFLSDFRKEGRLLRAVSDSHSRLLVPHAQHQGSRHAMTARCY